MTTREMQERKRAREAAQTSFAQRAARFGLDHFGRVNLGHKKRNEALISLADCMSRHPGGTLPQKLASPAKYKSLMRLANRKEVTHQAVLQPHYERTRLLMDQTDGISLIIHDITELDYSGLDIDGLGQIGNGHGRGYLCFNSLVVDAQQRQVLGLANQILHRRPKVGKKEGVKAKRERKDRESFLWTRAVETLGPGRPDKVEIDIADRGADIFEFLAAEVRLHRSFVVRACYDRAILNGHGQEATKTKLYSHLRSQPAWGHKEITARDADGTTRKTQVAVTAAPVQLLPPHVRRGHYEKRPLSLWAVRVWEVNPPPEAKPVEWVLLTDRAVETVKDAWQRTSWYECRWIVEEYHKAQKTGCNIEDMQFTTAQALQPVIALQSVIALLLLNLRDASRREDAKVRPASTMLDREYIDVLSAWRYKECRDLTIHEFFYALARLGGHQNRKGDGQPGWLVLWRGWIKLQCMVAGAEAAKLRPHKEQIRGQT